MPLAFLIVLLFNPKFNIKPNLQSSFQTVMFLALVLPQRGGDRIYDDKVSICNNGTLCPLYSAASLG